MNNQLYIKPGWKQMNPKIGRKVCNILMGKLVNCNNKGIYSVWYNDIKGYAWPLYYRNHTGKGYAWSLDTRRVIMQENVETVIYRSILYMYVKGKHCIMMRILLQSYHLIHGEFEVKMGHGGVWWKSVDHEVFCRRKKLENNCKINRNAAVLF